MDVLGYDVRPDFPRDRARRVESLESLLPACDVVSLHVSYGPGSRGLFGREALARMKPEAVLVNTSRGGVLDEEALLEALAEGRIAGAALRRPPALARDASPAIEYVAHALATLEARERLRFGAVVILQPSSPMTLPEDVEATLALLRETGAESAATVMRVDHAFHPAKFKRLEGNRLLPYPGEEA